MAELQWAKTGDLALLASRFAGSWALIYTCPSQPPMSMTIAPGKEKPGEMMRMAPIFASILKTPSIAEYREVGNALSTK